MASLVVVLFPPLLLAFMLLMERVEGPLRERDEGEQVEEFLETAKPEEVDALVREGFSSALARWRERRRRLGRLLPLSMRSGPDS